MPTLLNDTKSFEAAVKTPKLTVVHFSADWAEQCKQVDDVLDALSKQTEYSQINFVKCQAEDLSEVSLKCNIDAVPTVVLFRSSKEIDRVNGADAAKITATIKQHIQSYDGNTSNGEAVSLDDRLKALINKSEVMLFMKGDRQQPRCGFSKKIIDILNNTGVSYGTFDILTDEEVRQGLKTFSNWPTYPQLYVKGELIGGLDIVKQMADSGELEAALKP